MKSFRLTIGEGEVYQAALSIATLLILAICNQFEIVTKSNLPIAIAAIFLGLHFGVVLIGRLADAWTQDDQATENGTDSDSHSSS